MALKKNVIYIYFKGKHLVTSKSQYQYNHGQFLYFADLDLPQTFEVHFSNTDEGYAKPQIGSNRLVEIPDAYFWTKSSQIYAWIYLHEGTTDGETKYEVIINLERRSEPVYEEILPTQQTTIERAIAELNNAVDVTTENANKTGEDRTQVSNIKDEIVDLKEDIDANAELATEKAQEAVNASLRSEASAQNAAEYESNAHGYSDEAKDYAQQALESKTIASQKATIATDASVETLGYRDETLVAKNDVLNLRQNVIDYRNETKGYLDETKEVRADVQDIDNEVKDYATQAQTSANNASASAQASANSASASAQSASEAQSASTNAETYALNSGNKAVESAQSASASANSASQAQGFAQSASASAQSASQYASQAQWYANTASNKASEASTSAQTASQKATESAQSATSAQRYAQTAEQAKTDSQTAQGLAESARDTAVSAKTDAESARDDAESARDEAQTIVDGISGALDDKAPVITDTASGAIASFSDGADDLPLKSLVVDINPIQDLHGQDAPYPAGGGKNKLPNPTAQTVTLNGMTCVASADGKYTISGTTSGGSFLKDFGVAEYTIQSGDFIHCGNSAQSFVAVVGLRYNDGTGTDFTISDVNRIVDLANEAGKTVIAVRIYVANNTTFDATIAPMIVASSTATTFSPYENICPISGWTEVNVNHSDADMTNPTTITIDLGQTVYGGKLDVLSGVMRVDRATDDMGNLTWSAQGPAGRCYSTSKRNTIKKGTSAGGYDNAFAEIYSASNVPSLANLQANQMSVDNGGNIQLYDTRFAGMTGTQIKAELQGVTMCYKLAEPIEIQLTPNQVNSLLGVNNIWADSGDTEVEYRADTKLYINKKIAEAIASITQNGTDNVTG